MPVNKHIVSITQLRAFLCRYRKHFMRFAPPSYSEGDTISSQESTDEISTSSFHIASEERLSMVLQSDNMSIDGVAQGSNTTEKFFKTR